MPQDSVIVELASADVKARERAAAEIFARGRVLIWPALSEWRKISSLQENLHSENPRLTIGVATSPDTFEKIRAANENPRLSEVPPDQDAIEFELHFAAGVRLDILTTRMPGGDGAIARFLKKFGEGIQQVEIDVRSVDDATKVLQTHFKLAPLYPATRAGADSTRVNFFLVNRSGAKKVLVELVER
jgi:hypothetical protein